ncbi:coenzyme PQQ biosynthesis protein PqqF [Klebsiella aerogenes]|nr:coenzyme PQQ biosynthesis protein PqqF [Klebsiella aerogenes]
MQLWLQGPQSLEVLGELATRFATGLAPGEAPPPAPPLTLGEPPQLQLAVSSQPALWRCPLIALSDNVTLLREFLLDEAPGSLMAGLRQRGMAEDVALNWLYQDQHFGWLALIFASDRPEQVDRQITHWLQALQQTTPEQQQHYYQLSRAVFRRCRPSISCASGHSACPRGAAHRVRRFLRRPAGRPHGQPGLPDAAPRSNGSHPGL